MFGFFKFHTCLVCLLKPTLVGGLFPPTFQMNIDHIRGGGMLNQVHENLRGVPTQKVISIYLKSCDTLSRLHRIVSKQTSSYTYIVTIFNLFTSIQILA